MVQLQELHLDKLGVPRPVANNNNTDEYPKIVIIRLASLLQCAGNNIQALNLSLSFFRGYHIKVLFSAMMSDNCRIERLTVYGKPYEDVDVALAELLRHPTNQLRSLNASPLKWTDAGYRALGKSLKDPNCKLQSLTVGDPYAWMVSTGSAETIAEALATNLIPLGELRLKEPQPFSVLQAFTKSLRSRNNQLKQLQLSASGGHQAACSEFHRAARTSNLIGLQYDGDNTFALVFSLPFVQVLYTLLSVWQIPRLGRSSFLRILPLQDLILVIAEVLGWPLNKLCPPDSS